MFIPRKMRQAGAIVVVTTLLLILPNLTYLVN
jgi:hypothetical protein